MAELSGLCRDLGSALLLISHDLAMAGRWCERMAMLEGGRTVEDGPAINCRRHHPPWAGVLASAREREADDLRAPRRHPGAAVEAMRWHAIGGCPGRRAG